MPPRRAPHVRQARPPTAPRANAWHCCASPPPHLALPANVSPRLPTTSSAGSQRQRRAARLPDGQHWPQRPALQRNPAGAAPTTGSSEGQTTRSWGCAAKRDGSGWLEAGAGTRRAPRCGWVRRGAQQPRGRASMASCCFHICMFTCLPPPLPARPAPHHTLPAAGDLPLRRDSVPEQFQRLRGRVRAVLDAQHLPDHRGCMRQQGLGCAARREGVGVPAGADRPLPPSLPAPLPPCPTPSLPATLPACHQSAHPPTLLTPPHHPTHHPLSPDASASQLSACQDDLAAAAAQRDTCRDSLQACDAVGEVTAGQLADLRGQLSECTGERGGAHLVVLAG